MRKVLYFLPAILFTLWTLCLNVLMGALIPLWHLWNILFWLSGWLLSRGRAWGCIIGLIPAAMIFWLKGWSMSVECMVAVVWVVYYLACGAWVWRKKGNG